MIMPTPHKTVTPFDTEYQSQVVKHFRSEYKPPRMAQPPVNARGNIAPDETGKRERLLKASI